MKNFSTAYNASKKEVKANNRLLAEQEHAQIVAAVKKAYSINSFANLSEAERASYKSMMNEMWKPETGLTDKGKRFLKEAVAPLTKDSTPEQIKKEFQRSIKADVKDYVIALGTENSNWENWNKIKARIEADIHKKLSLKACRRWTYQVVDEYIRKQLSVPKGADLNESIKLNEKLEFYRAHPGQDTGISIADGQYNGNYKYVVKVFSTLPKKLVDMFINRLKTPYNYNGSYSSLLDFCKQANISYKECVENIDSFMKFLMQTLSPGSYGEDGAGRTIFNYFVNRLMRDYWTFQQENPKAPEDEYPHRDINAEDDKPLAVNDDYNQKIEQLISKI